MGIPFGLLYPFDRGEKLGKYILKRVLQFIPVFLGVTLILFALQNIVPGDPIKLIGGDKALPPSTELQLRIKYDLVKSDENGNAILDENGDPIPTDMWERYTHYMGGLLQGDLGSSYQRKLPVTEIFSAKYPYTIKLAVCAIVLEAIMGIGAGIISAVKRYSFWDVLVTLTTSVLVAVPAFWLGMILQLVFGVMLHVMPISGAGGASSQFQDWMHYVLPSVTLASVSTAYTARIMRSQLLDVMNQDYIRTAKAKGLSNRAIIVKHALKNALIPVVTYIGVDFGAMLSGAILTETVFNWPGVGYEIYRAITMRDWPIVMGGVTLIVVVVMVVNLLVDVSYAFLDPRIRFDGSNKGK